jgi:uncharacterized membrane protein
MAQSIIRPESLHLIPEPWTYNPSKWSQRGGIAVMAAMAFITASYMGLYQWGLIDSVWDPIFGDQTAQVLESDLSHEMERIARIPDAILGSFAYLADFILALAGSTRRWQYRPWLVMMFAVSLIPLGFVSVMLVVLQGTVVGSWCTLCIVTAILSLAMIYRGYDEVWTTWLYLYRTYRRSRSFKLLWKTFFGHPSDVAQEVALEIARRSPA